MNTNRHTEISKKLIGRVVLGALAVLLIQGVMVSAGAQTSLIEPLPEGELIIAGCPDGVGLQHNQCVVETSTGSVTKPPELIALTSTDRQALTDNDGVEWSVIESPDHGNLAFSFQDEFYTDIYPCTTRVMAAEGKDEATIGPEDDTDCFFPRDWSGAGWLLLGYLPFDAPSAFYKVRPDGSEGAYLSRGDEDWSYGAWINRGSRILFNRQRSERLPRTCTMDASGSDIDCFKGTGGTQRLEVAPYRHRFAYTRFPKTKHSVLVRGLGGQLKSKLTLPDGRRPEVIRWAPNGRRIAIASYPADGEIFVGNVRTGKVRALALQDERITWVEEVEWAPSGNYLAIGAVDEDGYVAIFTMGRDGADWRQVTEWDRAQALQLWR